MTHCLRSVSDITVFAEYYKRVVQMLVSEYNSDLNHTYHIICLGKAEKTVLKTLSRHRGVAQLLGSTSNTALTQHYRLAILNEMEITMSKKLFKKV